MLYMTRWHVHFRWVMSRRKRRWWTELLKRGRRRSPEWTNHLSWMKWRQLDQSYRLWKHNEKWPFWERGNNIAFDAEHGMWTIVNIFYFKVVSKGSEMFWCISLLNYYQFYGLMILSETDFIIHGNKADCPKSREFKRHTVRHTYWDKLIDWLND